MNNIAQFFITNYKFTFVVSIGILIFGLMGIMSVNSETYPSVDFAMATINTKYDGATAKDIELKVTKPIEDELRKVSGIKDLKSISQSGRSTITIRVDDQNYDTATVMSDLERAVDRVNGLPKDLKDAPKFLEIKSAEMPVIEVAITGSNQDRARDIVADLLKEDIEDIKNVLGVRLVGYHARKFNIDLNLKKLDKFYIGIDEVIGKIKGRNKSIPGGKIKTPGAQKLIRIDGKIKNTSDLANLILRANYNGKAIRISDVAKVTDSQAEVSVLAQFNGEDATLLIATKRGGADTIKLVEKINVKLDRFKKANPDFRFAIYHDESIKVNDKLEILSSNAVTGLILVVFFLLLFLPGRIGIMASLSLPLSVLFTLGLMPVFAINLNAITILALVIALGMLVDNSVVISENFARLRSEGKSADDAIKDSIKHLWIPITATVFTTIAAFLPMLVTKGIMGKFILYIPIIVTIALLASLFESFFLLPMRLLIVDNNKPVNVDRKNPGFFDRFAAWFEKMVNGVVRFRYLTLIAFLGILVGSGVMMTVFNNVILFPSEQVEMYVARVDLPNGSTQKETTVVLREISQRIKEKIGKQIKYLVVRGGTSQVGPFDPKSKKSDNVGMINIYVDDETKNTVKDSIFLAKLREIETPKIAEVLFEARANGPPVGEAVNATIRSNDKEQLDQAVALMAAELKKVEGVRDVNIDDVKENQEISIAIDYKRAAMLGLSVDSIGNAIRTGISGKMVSNVNLGGKKVDFKLQLAEGQRLDDSNLSSIKILDRRGNLVPVSKVAKIIISDGSHQIKRYDYKRSKTITANIEKVTTTAIAANKKLQAIFDKTSESYPGLSLIFGGEQESTNESMSSLGDALILSLIGIFGLLVLLFNSFIRPAIIMSTIPLGLVGFSIAFAAHQKPISFLAMIGVIGLGGIIVNSGIILISFIDQLRKEENDLPLDQILAKASRLRLRAVLVSSLTTVSGLMPTAYGIGGLDAMLMPMTLAMAWGLTSGTILTLIWVPAAYAILEDITSLSEKIIRRAKGAFNGNRSSRPSISSEIPAGAKKVGDV